MGMEKKRLVMTLVRRDIAVRPFGVALLAAVIGRFADIWDLGDRPAVAVILGLIVAWTDGADQRAGWAHR